MTSKAAYAFLPLLISVALVGAVSPAPVRALTSSVPATLSVRIVPSILPADGGIYPAVYVMLVDSSGSPTLAIGNVTVYLTSSTPTVGTTLNSSVVISTGRGYTVAKFQSTPTVGSTVITASASGYASGSATVVTSLLRGYPTSISLSAVPSQVNSTSTSSRSGTLIVEFLDQAGLPAKSVANTPVSIYSSGPTILTLNATLFTMRAGQLVKVLSFVTRPVPGSTFLTASAPQLSSGNVQVTVLGRPPLSLKLFAQPLQLATSGSGRLVIALTDANGNPTRAPSNTLVQISSSNTTIVSTLTTAMISAGQIFTQVTLTSGSIPGSATITASSSGLTSDFSTISTYVPVGAPKSLGLYIGPSPVLADNGSYSAVVVSLLNSGGFPTVSSTNSYIVTLTSSQNSSVGRFGPSAFSTMTIPPGSNYVVWATPFKSTFVSGTTLLTASAQNLLSSTGKLMTFGPVPSKIAVASLFPTVPADGAPHPSLQVSLQDSRGGPAVAPTAVTVYLRSSQTGIAQVNSPIVISPGQSAAVVAVTTTPVAGTANLTAYTNSLSSGYTASSTSIKTVTPSPSVIGAFLAPGVLAPSNSQPGSLLFLQLQDSTGNPSRARQATQLTVTSSNTAVFNQTLQVQIPQGQSYVQIPIVPLQAGSTTFTVVSSGLTTATVQFQALPSPFSALISASSLMIFTNATDKITVTITLDGQGVSGVGVVWSAFVGTLTQATSTTNSQGQASAVLLPTGIGVADITAKVSASWAGAFSLNTRIIIGQPPLSGNKGLLGTLLSFPYILGLVGAAAAVAVLAFLLIRRRRRAAEAEGAISEEESGFSYTRLDTSLGLAL